MNIFDSIVNEVDYKGVVRKQRSINRLFPDWKDKVKGIAKLGGLRMLNSTPSEWVFKIHSGTDKNKWYDVHLAFKNVQEMLEKYVPDKRLWVKDKSRIDRRKLAKKVLYAIDIELGCSCPAQQYWGGAYITSLPKYAAKYGEPETRSPKIRNPKQYGMVCKHLQNLINVLPFYETTMAQWLTRFYDKNIKTIEQRAKEESDKFKAAGKALGQLKKEVEQPVEPSEVEKPGRTKRPRVKPETSPTIKTSTVRRKLKDKGITKESVDEKITDPYGGLPAGGYYSSNTEYEIGAQRIAEAAHCIIGSCIKSLYMSKGLDVEKAHILEEMDIIKNCIQEYMRRIYIEQLQDNKDNKYVKASFTSMTEASEKLYVLVNDILEELVEIKEPDAKELIEKSLLLLKALSLSVLKSLKNYPDIQESAFIDRRLLRAANSLENSVTKIFNTPELQESFKERVGNCYPLSGRYVLHNPTTRLVHGTINGKRMAGKDFDNPHAWVEKDGNVFDPVLDITLDKDVYYEMFQANPVNVYDKDAMLSTMLRFKHWGPWDTEPVKEIIEWRKVGKHTYIKNIGKYSIVLRPDRTTNRERYGKTYSIFVDEAVPGEKNVWKTLGVLEYGDTLSAAKKRANEWIQSNVLKSKVEESNTLQIISHSSQGVLKILSSKGVKYVYNNINPFIYKKIENLLKYKKYGQVWKILKPFDVEVIEDEKSQDK